MVASTEMQACRYELKYLITESQALAVRQYIAGFLEPDEFAAKSATGDYPVRSVYLDSPSMTLFRQTEQGAKNRYKLRIRFYDECEESPCFLEVKRRESDVILKQRTGVTRDAAHLIANGMRPSKHHLFGNGAAKGREGFATFCDLRDHIQATGQVYVAYDREAYMSPIGNNVRVTFDRNIRGARYSTFDGVHLPDDTVAANLEGVVLELKFTDRFPGWVRDLVRTFNLQRQSVPKYVECHLASKNAEPVWLPV
jgi:hypothetical protein